ncbi:MAG TPA: hypothetical protein ENN83_09550 [Rhodovulum sp.]|nr:hypothetical protein [Rhodovulum sp.]
MRSGTSSSPMGGLAANGPALAAALDLRAVFGVPVDCQSVLSLGTTLATPRPHPARARAAWGALDWLWRGNRLLDLPLGGQVDLQTDLLRGLGPRRLIVLDEELDPGKADAVHLVDAGLDARAKLAEAAARTAARIPPDLRKDLDRLLARRLAFVSVPGDLRPRPCLIPPEA